VESTSKYALRTQPRAEYGAVEITEQSCELIRPTAKNTVRHPRRGDRATAIITWTSNKGNETFENGHQCL